MASWKNAVGRKQGCFWRDRNDRLSNANGVSATFKNKRFKTSSIVLRDLPSGGHFNRKEGNHVSLREIGNKRRIFLRLLVMATDDICFPRTSKFEHYNLLGRAVKQKYVRFQGCYENVGGYCSTMRGLIARYIGKESHTVLKMRLDQLNNVL